MDIYVMEGLQVVDIISEYHSIVWNVQYFDKGEFVMVCPASSKVLEALQVGRYLVRSEDYIGGNEMQNVMVISKFKLDYDAETGWLVTVSGYGLKSIVGKRVVWNQTSVTGYTEDVIRQVIYDNIINPVDSDRAISNFLMDDPVGFTDETEVQLLGENIADWLSDICRQYGYGWDVYIKNGKYRFKLYAGKDRTYSQNVNPVVVFSPQFDNLITASYEMDIEGMKNAALVGGEGEGASQRTATIGTATDIDRNEEYIDGGSVSSNGEIITLTQYISMLADYGQTQLDNTQFTQKFSGDINPDGTFKINEDFFLGDIVQIQNDKGIQGESRIIEIIYSEDDSGYRVVPTFSDWEVE